MAPADTLVCDTAQVAAWQSDPAFAYSRELIAPEINVLEWFSRWFGKLLDKIFGNTLVAEYSEVVLICIAVLILVLVIWFVYKKRPELFMRSRKSTLPYTVGEDTSMEWILRKELPMRLPGRIIGRRCVCSICRR